MNWNTQTKKFVTCLFFLLIIATGFIIYHLLPRLIVQINLLSTYSIDKDLKSKELFQDVQTLNFDSKDGLNLSAFFRPTPSQSPKALIILIHGIRSHKGHFIKLSERLTNQGFHVAAIDLRAHGLSEGKYCTFGVKEKKDIQNLIDVLQKEIAEDIPIGVWGQSLGGAVALQAMSVDSRIDFGIVESTFSNFESIVHNYVEFHAGFNFPLLTNFLIKRAATIADFDINDASPKSACSNVEIPVLMVHGSADKRIPVQNATQNAEALVNSNSELYIVKKANHLNVWTVGGEQYFNKIDSFITCVIDTVK